MKKTNSMLTQLSTNPIALALAGTMVEGGPGFDLAGINMTLDKVAYILSIIASIYQLYKSRYAKKDVTDVGDKKTSETDNTEHFNVPGNDPNQQFYDIPSTIGFRKPGSMYAEYIAGIGNTSVIPAAFIAWKANPANKYKAVTDLKENVSDNWAGAVDNYPKNSVVGTDILNAVDSIALNTAYVAWKGANPNKCVIRNPWTYDGGLATSAMIIDWYTASPGLSVTNQSSILNIYYYDMSPIAVPNPASGTLIPPACPCLGV